VSSHVKIMKSPKCIKISCKRGDDYSVSV